MISALSKKKLEGVSGFFPYLPIAAARKW